MNEPTTEIQVEVKPKKKGRHCRNPNCGWKIIEYPIWKGQEIGEPFSFNKINWYNMIVGDWTKALVIVTILLMSWAYYHDTQAINMINQNPCDFVEKNIQPCKAAKENNKKLILSNNGTMFEFNYTGIK